MAKKKKRTKDYAERELHERRRYGFFWYDWIWRLVRPVMVFVTSFVLVCGLVYTGYSKVNSMFFAPMDAQDTTVIQFKVASGSSLSSVARDLEEAGLISNHTVFKYMADFMGMGQKIQSGNYELSRSMSSTQILDQLISGDGRPLTTMITIIPGWTVEDVAQYLVDQKILASPDTFLALCRDGKNYSGYEFVGEVIAKGDPHRTYVLEGYLSPNTYEIYTNSSEDTIIKRLLSQTEAAYPLSYVERAQEIGLTMDEVSAVFHNRLRLGMPLGSDVTIKYVSGSEKMVLGSEDLAVDSPYNTYRYEGLPPGPVCNPSMAAVVAALYPDEQYMAQKYLYFCSTDPNSGELHFSRTLEEHEAAVAMYRPLWEEYDQSRGLQ